MRIGLHALAEHVLAPLRYRAEGRIGLQPGGGGVGPPLPDGRRVLAVGDRLLDGDRSAPITTLGDAGRFLDVAVGAPTDVYATTTPADPDRPLAVTAPAAELLGSWFGAGLELLEQVAGGAGPDDDPTEIQLWPEHFDLALVIGSEAAGRRANVGVSPGDADHAEPYVYVGPWQPRTGEAWNEPWGASLGYEAIRGGADPLAFLARTLRALGG